MSAAPAALEEPRMGYQFTIGDQVSTATVEINGSYRGFLEALKQADAELIGT